MEAQRVISAICELVTDDDKWHFSIFSSSYLHILTFTKFTVAEIDGKKEEA